MPKFAKAIEAIAVKSAANGGPTTQDILTALVASHEDAWDSAQQIRAEVEDNKIEMLSAIDSVFSRVVAENEKLGDLIEECATIQKKDSDRLFVVEGEIDSAPDKMRLLMHEYKQPPKHREGEHQNHTDERDEDKELSEVVLSFRLTKWLIAAIILVLLSVGGNYLVDRLAVDEAAPQPHPTVIKE